MYLSQLKITGFKSFADSHTVDFNQGITAIVGPNGCGKSNIIDAIRWVLGEQRVRVLRSEKMEDVIFSGTIRRKPLNFAEVTLSIVNDRGIIPVEYGTVHITRRIFRTGESDYFINKKLCRLKDIHNLFYDTGMGIGSYSLMEQKMIDTVLSDKDDERRTMFEEAAGINKYRNQRKEALKNLIKTTDDLQRLTDLLGEKERTVKMLARHVTKARKYREYNDELTKLEVSFTGRYFAETGGKLKQASRDHAALIADREKLNAEKSGAETVVEEKELLALKKEERMSAVNQEISRFTEEIHEIENAVVAKKEKIESARRAIAQTEQYQQQSHANIERLKKEQAVVEEHIIRLESGIVEAEAAYLTSRQAFDAFDAEVAERRQALNKLQQEKITLLEQEAALKSSLEKMKSTVDNLMENKIHQEQSISAEKDRLSVCRENIRRCQASLKEVNAEYHNLSASRDALLSKIEEAENQYRHILEQEKVLEAQRISDEKKLEFIEEMKKNHEGYKAAVRSVIEGDIGGIQGIVADVIHVNPDHIVPIESALGSRVQYVLAETEDAALAAVDFLRKGKLGKASFAVQRAVKPARRPDSLQALETLPGVIGWADRFVSFKGDYQALASMLLGDVLLVESPGVLQDVRARCGDFNVYCITPDGSVFTTHGIIRGGEFGKEDVGLISQSKFIETLNENTRKCRSQIDEKEREKKATLATL
jgi:chromosome segregation protein